MGDIRRGRPSLRILDTAPPMLLGLSTQKSWGWRVNSDENTVTVPGKSPLPLLRENGHLFLHWEPYTVTTSEGVNVAKGICSKATYTHSALLIYRQNGPPERTKDENALFSQRRGYRRSMHVVATRTGAECSISCAVSNPASVPQRSAPSFESSFLRAVVAHFMQSCPAD